MVALDFDLPVVVVSDKEDWPIESIRMVAEFCSPHECCRNGIPYLQANQIANSFWLNTVYINPDLGKLPFSRVLSFMASLFTNNLINDIYLIDKDVAGRLAEHRRIAITVRIGCMSFHMR